MSNRIKIRRFFTKCNRWLKTTMLSDNKAVESKAVILRDEVLALALAAFSFVTFLSFLSFSEVDTTRQMGVDDFDNWLGPLGSSLSLRCLSYFGVFAFCFPVMGFYLSFLLLFGTQYAIKRQRFFGGLALLLGLLPAVGQLWQGLIKNTFFISGELGESIRFALVLYMAPVGLFVLSGTIIMASILVILERPLISLSLYALKNYFQEKKKEVMVSKTLAMLPPIEINKPHLTILPPQEIESSLKKESLIPKAPDEAIKKPKDFDIQIVEREKGTAFSMVEPLEKEREKKDFVLPALNLLDYDSPNTPSIDPELLKKEADKLQRAFLQFGIEGKIREIRPGPVVTNYEFVPAPGIKLSRIAALSDDIAMAMAAVQVRIVTPIPGKGAVGIEVPNEKRETVYLKEIVADPRYIRESHPLCMAVGKDVEGNPYFMNLADMPHVLIAGTTGSGKSVSVNAMICSLLYRATPKEVRFLMIDPKMLELSIYNGIPHLLLPPIIDSKKAANALKWAVKEMDQRYALMKEAAVRDISSYNQKLKTLPPDSLKEVGNRKHEHLPYIVIVVDEYADLLAIAGKEIESYIMRLAQKARACGIHVMLATQRPSVDVITGVIKANFPVRMGFRLASSHDSKTIVNKTGAEKLLGRGDVLIMPAGTSDLFRVHGAFISEKELSRVVEFLCAQSACEYREDIADFDEFESAEGNSFHNEADFDEKFTDALNIVKEHRKCSTSFLQRHLSVGYNRAARIVEQMEKSGMVGPVLNAKGEREIFVE